MTEDTQDFPETAAVENVVSSLGDALQGLIDTMNDAMDTSADSSLDDGDVG